MVDANTETAPPGNRKDTAAVDLGLDGALDHEPLARADPAPV